MQSLFQKFFNFSSFYYFSKTEASTSAQTGVGKKTTREKKTNNAVNNSKGVCWLQFLWLDLQGEGWHYFYVSHHQHPLHNLFSVCQDPETWHWGCLKMMNLLGALYVFWSSPAGLTQPEKAEKGARDWQVRVALGQMWGHQGVLQCCQEPNFVLRQQCCKLCPVFDSDALQGLQSETITSFWAARGDLPACPQCLRVPRQRTAMVPRYSPHMLPGSDIYWSVTCDGASDQSVSFPYIGCKGWQLSFFVLLLWRRKNNTKKKIITSEGDNLFQIFCIA